MPVAPRPKTKTSSKFGNHKAVCDGVEYDSKAELRYKGKLDLRVRAGEITGYDYHIVFPLIVNGTVVTKYEADFVLYFPDGSSEVHDVKGAVTKDFAIKKKLFKACTGDDIILIDPRTLRPKEPKSRKKKVTKPKK